MTGWIGKYVKPVPLKDCPTGGTRQLHGAHEWSTGIWPFRKHFSCSGLDEQFKWTIDTLEGLQNGTISIDEARRQAMARLESVVDRILPAEGASRESNLWPQ